MASPKIRLSLVPIGDGTDRSWLLTVGGVEAGRVSSVQRGDQVTLEVFVNPEQRGRGVARSAVGRIFGLAPWGDAVVYHVLPHDAAGEAVARATGFSPGQGESDGSRRWSRSAPRVRGGRDGVTRFLDADGRIDRYPVRNSDRHALLEYVVARALPRGVVVDEAGINARLEPFAPGGDVAVLRRYLVDHSLVERTPTGSEYARVDR
jgi:hypothetical protein